MATMSQIKLLSDALRKALERAHRLENFPDGGTSNFDTPQLFLSGWDEADIKKAFDGSGARFYINQIKKNGDCIVDIIGCLSGQGNRRTAMAEEVTKSLKEDGYESYVFYQMD